MSSETICKLGASIQITEWIDPQDLRLEVITGEPSPNSGGILREPWELGGGDEERHAARLVRGLVVPCRQLLVGSVAERFNRRLFGYGPELGEGQGNVEVYFTHLEDWHSCMPVHERAKIFKEQDNKQAWAALALCRRTIGLAVFAIEQEGGGVQARVQRVPEDVLQRL